MKKMNAFESVYAGIDHMIMHVHPNINVRKAYALLRISGYTASEASTQLELLIIKEIHRKSLKKEEIHPIKSQYRSNILHL